MKNSRIFRKDFLHVSTKASATQQLGSPGPCKRALSPKQENNDHYYVKPCTMQLTMTSMKAMSTPTQRASLSPRKTSECRAHGQMGTKPPKEGAAQPPTLQGWPHTAFCSRSAMKYNRHTLLHFTLTATPRAGCYCNAYCMHRQESGLHLSENGTWSPREGMEHTVHRL